MATNNDNENEMNGTAVFEPQVLVVDFHHARGPEIEFWISDEGQALSDRNDWSLLPFLALADGAHAVVEEFSYFTLLSQTEEHRLPRGEDKDHRQTPTDVEAVPRETLHDSQDVKHISLQQNIKDEDDMTEVDLSQSPLPGKTSSKAVTNTNKTTLFGISCTRQIRSDLLKNKSPDVTRSTVQKAIVVLLERPTSLGGVRERLSAVASAWFGQQDFTNIEILKDFQDILKHDAKLRIDELDYHLGLSIREVIYEFRYQTLIMLKALLLQKKILFFGSRCERICLLQFALISLIPNLMQSLQDCADPALDTYATTATRVSSLKTSERSSLLAYMGLPLQIFGKSSFFSPYTPLQLLDILMDSATHSFVVGSTNNLLLLHKDRYCDVIVNLDEETNKVQILNPDLRGPLTLSAADRRWIDHVTQTVLDTWDPENPSRPNTHGYGGSEDAIRLQFEEYILNLLSSVAYKVYHDRQPFFDNTHASVDDGYTDPTETSNDFNNDFLMLWKQTPNYALFDQLTRDAGIFDIIEPKHPTSGGLNIEDVQRRLAQGVAELHLDERVREGRETVGRVLDEGRERVGAGVARFWKEVDDFRQRREASRTRNEHQKPSITIDTSAVKDDTVQYNPARSAIPASANTPASSRVTSATWVAALRDRASKVQIQRPAVDTAQLSSAARDNAAKAGQYLSSWGSWARERGKEWSESRNNSPVIDRKPSSAHPAQSIDETAQNTK